MVSGTQAGLLGKLYARLPVPTAQWAQPELAMRGDWISRWAWGFAVCCVVCATACTAGQGTDGHVGIHVAPVVALADQPVEVRVTGLAPGEVASLQLRSTDARGVIWSSSAEFRASRVGVVDPADSAALSGSYTGLSAMGLFWSMQPQGRSPDSNYFWNFASPLAFELTVSVDGAEEARAMLSRRFSSSALSATVEHVRSTGFYGEFFSPATTTRRPGVIIIGGSQGGLASPLLAASLAARGYPALAIAYIKEPGLPHTLSDIPLAYFVKAVRWLRRQPGVDTAHVLALGVSFGSEAALLLGAHYPGLVNGVIASDPSDVATSPCPTCSFPAWTLGGRPLPYTTLFDVPTPPGDPAAVIPVQQIKGPVFLVCGGADRTWTSCEYAGAIMARLAASHDTYSHIVASYPAAGHGVGYLVPYEPVRGTDVSPQDLGSSADANPNAVAALWPRLLQFLAAL